MLEAIPCCAMPDASSAMRSGSSTLPIYRAGVPARIPKYDNRTVLEAVLWIARTGFPGRDLPAEFGRWDTIYQRCHRRCQDGVFSGSRFEGLTADLEPDWDTVMVGTFVKVHQHSTGAPKRLPARRLPTAGQPRPLASVAGDCPPGLWRCWIKRGHGPAWRWHPGMPKNHIYCQPCQTVYPLMN